MMCSIFGGHKYHMLDYSERLEVIFRMCVNCNKIVAVDPNGEELKFEDIL